MKMSKGLLFLVIAMLIISLICLSMGITYGFLYQTKLSNSLNISTSNLDFDVDYSYTSDSSLYKTSDSDGLKGDSYGTVKVTNKSNYNSYFTLSISYATDALLAKTGKSSISDFGVYDLMPLEYIKVAVFGKDTGGKLIQLTDPMVITDCPIISVSDIYQAAKYKIYEGTLNKQKYKTYVVKIWMDENITNNPNYDLYDEALLYLKLDLDAEPLNSKLITPIKGTIKLGTNAISTQITNLTTGETTTSAVDGTFTLNNFYENETYILKVNYSNKDYYTTVHIAYADDESWQIRPSTNLSGSYQALAYTYYTTVGQIKRKNSISLSSNSNNATCSNCAIPVAYALNINEDKTASDESIKNIVLSLQTDGTINLE